MAQLKEELSRMKAGSRFRARMGSQSLLASSCFLQAGLEQVQQWIPQGAVEGYLEAESLPS